MDRLLEKKRWTAKGLALPGAAVVAVAAAAYLLSARSGATRLRVDPTRMTTAEVTTGEFEEYYPFDGKVEPVTTVYLDVEEGGRVEQIFVEGGHPIEKGDLILRFSNPDLQRTSIDTETRLLENLDTLRNTQFNRAQSSLLLKDALLDLNYKILDAQKRYDRYKPLVDGTSEISKETFDSTRDELAYLKAKRKLLEERIKQEDTLGEKQVAQANDSIKRLTLSLDLLNRIVDGLEVRAPISGILSSIDAEVGQNINRGQRIGQIDQLDAYKVNVSVDQYYISRVDVGTTGKVELGGHDYPVTVKKVYPEVVNDAFAVDVDFAGHVPPDLKRGQRLTVELSFSEPTQSLMVAKGGFFQQSAGRWVYLISEDRKSAMRTPIRVGRQNPRNVEILEGLRPGDWIVSSSYDAFNNVDELRFTKPIPLLH
ncbi:MAG TPA: HlyD family efflux transporter periplasmic adaptor subunit [Gammaproteobacteria bacterium]|nr:HlyD family efflux transporter periplasmic adaptor subunit [Gammaproteobacteria bacterium]